MAELVLHLTADAARTFDGPAMIDSAAASSRAMPPARLTVERLGRDREWRETDRVTLWVPHTWWDHSAQGIAPGGLADGEALRFSIDHGEVDLRLVYRGR